jgi:hypothetical protein
MLVVHSHIGFEYVSSHLVREQKED